MFSTIRMPPKKGTMVPLSQASSDVLSLWDPSNELDISRLGITSHKIVGWVCPNGHCWKAPIYSVSRGSRCPYCSGRVPVVGKNDRKTVCPDLVREWPPRNEKLPESYTARSHAKVYWNCKNGHEWVATIGSRFEGNGCPFCAKRKPSP